MVSCLFLKKKLLSAVNFPQMTKDKIKKPYSSVEEYVPIPSTEAVFDFDVLNNPSLENKQDFLRINLTAFSRILRSHTVMFLRRLVLSPFLLRWR